MGWLRTLAEHGVKFGFPEDLVGIDRPSIAVLKHDIHDDLDRAVAMASLEQQHAISGIYFMMGPHVLNRRFYGSQRSWEQLRTIQSLGHRIGLHLDVFDALRRGGVYEFIARTLADFSREGIELRYGNSHGDRRFRNIGVRPADFFTECVNRAGDFGRVKGFIKGHVGNYSLQYLAERFGLEYWVDARLLRHGRPLNRTLYVTDNTGRVRIGSRGISSKRFEIDDDFIAASVPVLASTQSLILLHPQWYVAKP
jgi:hypothetical protein